MLKLSGVEKRFEGEGAQASVLACTAIDLVVTEGEFLTLIGPSGCGKSTLLEIVAGLEPATSGDVTIHGEPLTEPHPDIGVVFQQDATFPWLNNLRNVEFSLAHRGIPKSERSERAHEMLKLVGLDGFAQHHPDQLSGGMRQRLNIARTLAPRPRLVLMDEPFGALDEQTRLVLGDELLRIWRETGATIIFITHSLNEATMLSDRVAVMTSRPGTIKSIVETPLGPDRSSHQMGTEAFTQMTAQLWTFLEDEARQVERG